MMASAALQRDERIGLGIAIVLHAALFAVLLIQPPKRLPTPVPERMTVSLANDVGLEATAPSPESRAAVAPILSDEPAQIAEPLESAVVEPQQPAQTPLQPARQPARKALTPKEKPPTTSNSRTPAPKQPTKKAPAKSAPTKKGGGSRIGSDFLPGAGSSTTSSNTSTAAPNFGAKEQADLRSAMARQLRPHWRSPQGVDVDKLVTLLDWDLNEDGSLRGKPRLASQSGVNDSNRAQASVHVENAIRAVQLAAPFNLPPQFYDKWKRIRGARFDRNL